MMAKKLIKYKKWANNDTNPKNNWVFFILFSSFQLARQELQTFL